MLTRLLRRPDVRAGARLIWLPVLLTLLANLPGRRALGAFEAEFGSPAWQYIVGGFFGDLAGVMPLFAGVLVLREIGGSLLARKQQGRSAERRERAGAWAAAIVLAILAVNSWLLSVGATEFKLQRGLYPTWFEINLGITSWDFVRGELPTLALSRYVVPNVVFAVGTAIALAAYVRAAGREPESPARAGGLALATLAVVALSGITLASKDVTFPAVDHRRVLYPPAVTLYKSLGTQNRTAIFRGLGAVFTTAKFDPGQKEAGGALLGYSPRVVAATMAAESSPVCSRHPLSHPLPGDPPATDEGSTAAAPLVTALVALSRALFEGRTDDLVLFQAAIESYRGDDVHGLNPAASDAITPFTTSMYTTAAKDPAPDVLAFPHAYQGGMRTSQAVSGYLCGLGAMPFNLAVSRDLGYVPLRCLPDVLADAGFRTYATYGADLSFDNMIEFYRYHGVKTVQKVDFPHGLPTGTWGGITDWPVYQKALETAGSGGSQYHFVLTLAGHTPFDRPEDLPKEVDSRVTAGLASAGIVLSTDDRKRIDTMAYADWAVANLVKAIDASPIAARTVLLVSADHSTGDPFVWKTGRSIQAGSRIPFFIYFPPAMIDKATGPAAVREKIAALNRLLETTPISANDFPTIVLSLLASSHEIASLPPERRWTTLGGLSTSPFFSHPRHPKAQIFGIDTLAAVFTIDAGTDLVPIDTKERSESFSGPEQLDRLGPTLSPIAAFLGSFMTGYGSKCAGAENVRYTGLKGR